MRCVCGMSTIVPTSLTSSPRLSSCSGARRSSSAASFPLTTISHRDDVSKVATLNAWPLYWTNNEVSPSFRLRRNPGSAPSCSLPQSSCAQRRSTSRRSSKNQRSRLTLWSECRRPVESHELFLSSVDRVYGATYLRPCSAEYGPLVREPRRTENAES